MTEVIKIDSEGRQLRNGLFTDNNIPGGLYELAEASGCAHYVDMQVRYPGLTLLRMVPRSLETKGVQPEAVTDEDLTSLID